MERFGVENIMAVPKITKITLNMGVGEAIADRKMLDNAVSDIERISGQKAGGLPGAQVRRRLQDP